MATNNFSPEQLREAKEELARFKAMLRSQSQEQTIKEASRELSYLNGTVIPYLRQKGYTDQNGKLNLGMISLACKSREYFRDLEKVSLKYEFLFDYKNGSVKLNNAMIQDICKPNEAHPEHLVRSNYPLSGIRDPHGRGREIQQRIIN